MSRAQVVRHVVLPHIMKVLFPPLSNQYIVMTLGTSMGALFGLEELTGRAFNVESRTFRSLEIFSIVAGRVPGPQRGRERDPGRGRAVRLPRPPAGRLMLDSLADELPRFLTYYNGLLLLQGLLLTLLLSVAGVVGGSVLGGSLALARVGTSRWWLPARLGAMAYVETVRRIPFLVTLMLVFFGFRFLRPRPERGARLRGRRRR